MNDSQEIRKVMISSTSFDLPQHRAQVVEACLRQGLFPIDMKHLPARDITPLAVDQEMIDSADVYLGIYAFRYGTVAEGEENSYTELEFERAAARGIPCLIFLMSAEHPVLPRDVETTPGAQEKLAALKARASKGRICKEFKSAEDLRSQVIDALSQWKQKQERASDKKSVPSFHPPSHIPQSPKPYVAHPYVLLQTKSVIGRRAELNELTDWSTKNEKVPADTRIFSVVAIGGMGKSALTWKWFEDIAPNELPNLAGRMWWSFYESDAHWENFIIRALAYSAGMPEADVRQLPPPEREDRLLRVLDERPFLLVLDGLERILLAYARMDSAHLPDDDIDEQTANANAIVGITGVPDDVRGTYLDKHRFRQCADLRAGAFLRKLARVRAARVIISTRLYPAELQTQTARPLPGCHVLFLPGLTDDDAIALWRGFIGGERSGTSNQLLPLFRAFGNYPLLLRALAGDVAQYRPAPGDFDRWRNDHPDFNPAALPLKNAKTHVLEYALRGLGEAPRRVLHTLAAFRMPATWETLRGLLCGKHCVDDCELDSVLTELEDRGLVGWEKKANRYDLHPIVRGVVWTALDMNAKKDIYRGLSTYFDAAPKVDNWRNVEQLEDLTAGIELYRALIGLEEFEQAHDLFHQILDRVTDYRFNASRLRIELLSPLVAFTDDGDSRLVAPASLLSTFVSLGRAYLFAGEPYAAVQSFANAVNLSVQSPLLAGPDPGSLGNLGTALRSIGHLYEATRAEVNALAYLRKFGSNPEERHCCVRLGLTLAARGQNPESAVVLQRAMLIATKLRQVQFEGFASAATSQRDLWFSESKAALNHASHALHIAERFTYERDFIRTARLHGTAALGLGDQGTAEERLLSAISRARAVNLVEEELPLLATLAELNRLRKKYDAACELLEQVWAPAERGPYPLWHADSRNVLAQLERDRGHRDAAIEAATAAYRLAWCDGPPYAYHYGLTNARRHLQELGVPDPHLPPFDASKYEPIPNLELNPKDQFWVDPKTLG